MKKKFLNVLFVLLCIVFIFSIIKMGIFLKELYDTRQTKYELADEVVQSEIVVVDGLELEHLTIDFDFLAKKNKDIKGWIKFNAGKVNYPIMQTDNNDYYLNHNFNKKKNSLGAIFMDYRNTSLYNPNVILFGHNSSNGDMFGSLKDTLDEGLLEERENRIIQIVDLDNYNYYYEIFSAYTITKEEYYITTKFTDKEFEEFLLTVSGRSAYDFDVDLTSIKNVLTLSTCKGVAGTNKRFVIHARLMKDESL